MKTKTLNIIERVLVVIIVMCFLSLSKDTATPEVRMIIGIITAILGITLLGITIYKWRNKID